MSLTLSGISNGKLNNLSLSSSTGNILDDKNTTFFGADQFRLTTSITGTNADIASNLERIDHSGAGSIGTGMTESSGIFTFPNTGIWLVVCENSTYFGSVIDASATIATFLTVDNSSYNKVTEATNGSGLSSQPHRGNATSLLLVDVTDVSLVKVKFVTQSLVSSSVTIDGNTDENRTCFSFIRLGDT